VAGPARTRANHREAVAITTPRKASNPWEMRYGHTPFFLGRRTKPIITAKPPSFFARIHSPKCIIAMRVWVLPWTNSFFSVLIFGDCPHRRHRSHTLEKQAFSTTDMGLSKFSYISFCARVDGGPGEANAQTGSSPHGK